jgi:hypothetical protein
MVGKKRKKDGKMVLTHGRRKVGIWKIERKKKSSKGKCAESRLNKAFQIKKNPGQLR